MRACGLAIPSVRSVRARGGPRPRGPGGGRAPNPEGGRMTVVKFYGGLLGGLDPASAGEGARRTG